MTWIKNDDLKQHVGEILKVMTFNPKKRIAAKLINVTDDEILLENSNGYRNSILKRDILVIMTMHDHYPEKK